jgi:hypothetical protein
MGTPCESITDPGRASSLDSRPPLCGARAVFEHDTGVRFR